MRLQLSSRNSVTKPSPPPDAPILPQEGALYGKDDIITGADKQQMQYVPARKGAFISHPLTHVLPSRYYLHFPLKFFSGRWELSLRRGGPQGPEICQILKGGSWSNSVELHWTWVQSAFQNTMAQEN